MTPAAETGSAGAVSGPEFWACAAERAAALLDGFVGASEAEFADFGRQVQECLALADDLARRAARAADALGETAAGDSVEGFRRHLAQLETHEASSRELSVQVREALQATAAAVGEIPAFARAFDRSVRTLRNLGVATLMESARLGAQGAEFSHLAADVQQLGERICAEFDKVLRRARTIGAQMEAARGPREQTGSGSAQDAARSGAPGAPSMVLGELLAELRGSDAVLDGLGVQAREASASIRESTGDLSAGVGAILTNMQAQDATRQKLEHVRDSLRLLARTLREPDTADQGDCAGFAAAVAGLQRTQLRGAREAFAAAFAQIESAARGVTQAAYRFDAAVAGLAQEENPGPGAGGKGLGLLEERLHRVARALGDGASRSAEVAEALSVAARGAQELTSHVAEIEELGLELELVAVNAITRASRTGSSGRPLAVIAREIQRQSAEARKNTQQVAARLSRIGDGARQIETLARSFVETAQANALRIAGELQSLVGTLGDAHARFLRDVDGLRRGASSLAAAVGGAVGGLTLPRRLAALAEDLDGCLRDLEADARARAPAAAASGKTSRELLDELARAYTMESQREIHRLLAHNAEDRPEAAPPAGRLPFGQPPSDLGDNVELF